MRTLASVALGINSTRQALEPLIGEFDCLIDACQVETSCPICTAHHMPYGVGITCQMRCASTASDSFHEEDGGVATCQTCCVTLHTCAVS